MSPFHPTLRSIRVLVFTPSGWIRGVFHVPEIQNFLAFLNHQEELLKLTDVVLPGSQQVEPFLGLYKSATLLVVPLEDLKDQGVRPTVGNQENRLVTCLLNIGSIRGRLDVPEAQRTSDFLLRHPGFMELRQCHIGPNSFLNPEETLKESLPVVYVNTKALVGTTENNSN